MFQVYDSDWNCLSAPAVFPGTHANRRSWLPPRIPSKPEFPAKITFIDSEGQIYVQPLLSAEVICQELEAELEEIAEAMPASKRASRPEDWFVGQIGAALYPSDHVRGWFRVKIAEVTKDSVMALFVDYGETKELFPAHGEMIKTIPRTVLEVPIQAVRCRLDNVVSVKGPEVPPYDKAFLEEIHRLIVDQNAMVKLTRPDVRRFPLPAVIKMEDEARTNLAREFVNRG